jgi:hypothetical protein
MPEQYIVAQINDSRHPVVMKREEIDGRDVYVVLTGGFLSVDVAGQVADALNSAARANKVAATDAGSDGGGRQPLYAGTGTGPGIDIPATVEQVYLEHPGMAFALAEAHGYTFRPTKQHNFGDPQCRARDDSVHTMLEGQHCEVCRPVEGEGD